MSLDMSLVRRRARCGGARQGLPKRSALLLGVGAGCNRRLSGLRQRQRFWRAHVHAQGAKSHAGRQQLGSGCGGYLAPNAGPGSAHTAGAPWL